MDLRCLVAIAALAGCGRHPSPPSLVRPHVTYAYGLYFTPEPRADPAQACRELRGPHVSVATVAVAEGPAIVDNLVEFYVPLMPDAHVDAVARSTKVTVVTVDVDGAQARAAADVAARLTGCLAHQTGALVWDEVTMQLFTDAEWARERVAKPAPQLVTADGDDGRPRTYGMIKLALPDLVLAGVPDGERDRAGTFLRRVADTVIAQPRVATPGRLSVAATDLRVTLAADLLVVDVAGTRSQVMATFDAIAGPPEEDDVVMVDPNDGARRAAVERARARLPEIRRLYNAGLAPGDRLAVKVRVTVRPDAIENMWLEPTHWDERAIRGVLMNVPNAHGAVQRGDELTISDELILDYQLLRADGSEDGNFTRPTR